MKTYYQLREQLSELHDEIALTEAKKPEHEDVLDNICEYLSRAIYELTELI